MTETIPLLDKDEVLGDWPRHLERKPGVMVGKPVFKGTRLSVQFVLEHLASGVAVDDLLRHHPALSRDQINAALGYAVELLRRHQKSSESL